MAGYIVSLIFGMHMRTLGHVFTDNGGWRRISHISQNQTPFLSVFDFSHIGKAETKYLMETGGQHRSSEQLKTELRALPTQETGSFRFYIGEDTEDGMELNKEVLGILKEESATNHYRFSGLPSFTRLRCQWNSQSRLVAWRSMSYGTSFGTTNFDKSLSDISLWFLASLMRFSKSICVAKDDRGCFSVFITVLTETTVLDRIFPNDSAKADLGARYRPKQADIHLRLTHFCDSLKSEITAEPFKELWKGTYTCEVLIQLVLMSFCRVSLAQLSEFVDDYQQFRTIFRETVTDPRRTTISISSTQDIVRDAYFYEELQGCVSDLSSASLTLLELLSINFRSPSQTSFDYLAADTRAICSDLTKTSNRLCNRLGQHIELFQLLRSFKESQGVWILGLLASIFLPLSLATGLLSMQTRLVDLHLIFYDFCGVIILIGTLVLIIIGLLNVYARLNEQILKSKTDLTFRRWIYPSIGVGFLVCCLITWCLLLSSFLVGMVKSVGLGLKILGYGAAAIGGVVLLF
ncbi:hypothetical protein HBI56_016630 [Parastagonospora nodorum]|nr:hypothetical protein HBI95_002930 [Parastagonospora nodorum]KAH4821034.1 hypothetical protein HBH61_019840 [Parastagonospora nodorum]KAH4861930.1 hypothetical protein HBH75_023650 [Parastagonospora nodorum]KAH5158692.1 hypothetical protein HBH69_065010 [Parastagonospora nodorum]KAH5332791.1 hypothetical protein HBI50_047390 [Parastagonospora nodorum]